ncbi:rhamnulokinase [Gracilibacillus dipsosauri]|uniref:Rhamnulokinase n=1 Tax=Gracilibacillus dipsosauri TaxID=178340 RepID=A0A317L111_9BACI|nr:rhamnulokinase [Gracilibacillus dipsosauri]PWU68730.1 rhamnulokinase [Gracilibacillus dipsosauri]
MQKCNLAVDIGASSGRVIAGYLANGKLKLDEIHRFDNGMEMKNGHLCWDIDGLYQELVIGLRKSVQKNYQPTTIGIDTWAVDFVLLDKEKNRITDFVAYRDHRTDGVMDDILKILDRRKLYQQTGIQFQPFNTIYQLYAFKKENPELMEKAKHFLMIPDYLNYLLTGTLSNEYTNATSTQLLSANSKTWNQSIAEALDIPLELFLEPKMPMQTLGYLKPELQKDIGFDVKVVLPGTHDTASAVVAVPNDESIYISSGTWSLIGVEHDTPITSEQAMRYNFTNEGGVYENIRFLKNIMGMWMIQEVKKELKDQYSFQEFVDLAYQLKAFDSIVDVNDERFLSPKSMIHSIQTFCQETNQAIPHSPAELAVCIFNSLVKSYQQAVKEIEEMTGKKYASINIIGGGSKNQYMNEQLAKATGKAVYTGPTEATAIGNLIAQMHTTGEIDSRETSKLMINRSFEIQKYLIRGEKNEYQR